MQWHDIKGVDSQQILSLLCIPIPPHSRFAWSFRSCSKQAGFITHRYIPVNGRGTSSARHVALHPAPRDQQRGQPEQGRQQAAEQQRGETQAVFQPATQHRAEQHAAPRHQLHAPAAASLAHQPAAEATAEAGEGAGDVGQADGQAVHFLDGRVEHAHGQDRREQRQQFEVGTAERGRQQQQGGEGQQRPGTLAAGAGDHHAEGIADDEGQHQQAQAQHQVEVSLADRHRQARGVAAHEGDEVAAGEEADGIGHAGQHREAADEEQPDLAALPVQAQGLWFAQGAGMFGQHAVV